MDAAVTTETEDGRAFPDVAGMTFAELLEAIAVNSDMAVYQDNAPVNTDEEADANRSRATAHFDRRVACMREVQRRFDAVGSPDAGQRAALTENERGACQFAADALDWVTRQTDVFERPGGFFVAGKVVQAETVLRRLAGDAP